ncbi:MAG: hypothetical protein E6I50_06030 [Chloroflexi bacterium]|nr:MAG: hypothetical protein E6I50_06030 [Chloroflexota bacterium]
MFVRSVRCSRTSWRPLVQRIVPGVAGLMCSRLSTEAWSTSWSKERRIGAAVETSTLLRCGE